ncbi:MAG: FeoA domain-containing protein [Thermoplasmata archaeon]|nr:FeoA domain-containing protein [Thermoplasmata archaeon]
MNWLRLLIDDILRFTREKNRPVSIKEIMDETNSSKIEVMDAIKEMEKEGLAKYKEKVSLTKKGEEMANEMYERHVTIEKFFGGKEAHEIAHSLEHLLEKKDIELMKDTLTRKKESLEEFEEGERGIIVAFAINDPRIISRLIGAGIAPMTPFMMEKKRSNEMIILAHNKVIALDKSLAKKIYAMRVENEGFTGRTA